jgi:hypothetical protein
VELEEALCELHENGDALRRMSWEPNMGLSLEDVIADDWEVVDYSEDDK